MSRVDTAMSRWLVYAQTHGLLSLDLRVFPPILERLRAYLQVPILYSEDWTPKILVLKCNTRTHTKIRVWDGLGSCLNSMGIFRLVTQRGL